MTNINGTWPVWILDRRVTNGDQRIQGDSMQCRDNDFLHAQRLHGRYSRHVMLHIPWRWKTTYDAIHIGVTRKSHEWYLLRLENMYLGLRKTAVIIILNQFCHFFVNMFLDVSICLSVCGRGWSQSFLSVHGALVMKDMIPFGVLLLPAKMGHHEAGGFHF